jgi:hypothetical protein
VPRIVLDTDVASLSYKGRLPAPLAARLVGIRMIKVSDYPAAIPTADLT